MIPTTLPAFRDRPTDMFPRFAKCNIADGGAVDAENIRNTSGIEALSHKYTNGDHFIVGKFMYPGFLSNGSDSMLAPIFPIRLTGIPSQIFGAVVKEISVIVTGFHSFGARACKSFQYQTMNRSVYVVPAIKKSDIQSPSMARRLDQGAGFVCTPLVSVSFTPRSDIAEIANFIQWVSWYFLPYLVHSVSQKVRPLLAVGCCLGSVGQKGRVLNKITDFPLCLDIGNYITEGGI